MNIGDSIGCIYKVTQDGKYCWKLIEDTVSKIEITKKYGKRYFTKSLFRPIEADEVDRNTKMMEEAIGRGYIFTSEIFGLNDKTRPLAERWVAWANENMDKAVGII